MKWRRRQKEGTLRKSQGGCFWRKSSSSHQAPICSGTNHCSDWLAQRGKHFSSPHREAMESRFIFPDGLSSSGSSRPSWSRFLWPAYSFCPALTIQSLPTATVRDWEPNLCPSLETNWWGGLMKFLPPPLPVLPVQGKQHNWFMAGQAGGEMLVSHFFVTQKVYFAVQMLHGRLCGVEVLLVGG